MEPEALICSVADCGNPAKHKGLCKPHYQRAWRHGDPNHGGPLRNPDPRFCLVGDCGRPYYAKDLCQKHWKRLRINGDPTVVRRRRKRQDICSIPNCGLSHNAKGLCNVHYQRLLKYGSPLKTRPRQVAGLGTRFVDSHGYVRIKKYQGEGFTGEHRLVMEESLGRRLLPGENVHHINGVRGDNRLENLELWVTLQPSGQRPEDLLQWADEIIARYRPKG
jgi:hypothetical protein